MSVPQLFPKYQKERPIFSPDSTMPTRLGRENAQCLHGGGQRASALRDSLSWVKTGLRDLSRVCFWSSLSTSVSESPLLINEQSVVQKRCCSSNFSIFSALLIYEKPDRSLKCSNCSKRVINFTTEMVEGERSLASSMQVLGVFSPPVWLAC